MRVLFSLVVAIAAIASLEAQTPNLSGTWKLDVAESNIAPAAGLAGLIGAGAPPMLFITQPANGTLVVESSINEGHARIYKPGGKTTTPVGQGGTIAMTSQWAGRAFVSEGTSVAPNGTSTKVKETYSISADGKVLTVEVTVVASGEVASKMTYRRITDVGPCETWPTPCKRTP